MYVAVKGNVRMTKDLDNIFNILNAYLHITPRASNTRHNHKDELTTTLHFSPLFEILLSRETATSPASAPGVRTSHQGGPLTLRVTIYVFGHYKPQSSFFENIYIIFPWQLLSGAHPERFLYYPWKWEKLPPAPSTPAVCYKCIIVTRPSRLAWRLSIYS